MTPPPGKLAAAQGLLEIEKNEVYALNGKLREAQAEIQRLKEILKNQSFKCVNCGLNLKQMQGLDEHNKALEQRLKKLRDVSIPKVTEEDEKDLEEFGSRKDVWISAYEQAIVACREATSDAAGEGK